MDRQPTRPQCDRAQTGGIVTRGRRWGRILGIGILAAILRGHGRRAQRRALCVDEVTGSVPASPDRHPRPVRAGCGDVRRWRRCVPRGGGTFDSGRSLVESGFDGLVVESPAGGRLRAHGPHAAPTEHDVPDVSEGSCAGEVRSLSRSGAAERTFAKPFRDHFGGSVAALWRGFAASLRAERADGIDVHGAEQPD